MLRLLFCTFVIMLFNASNGLAEKADFCIPKETGIRIDGQPGDWNGKGFDVGIMVPIGKKMKPAVDCGISVQLAWNKNGLLVMARVSDDKFQEDTENHGERIVLSFSSAMTKTAKTFASGLFAPVWTKAVNQRCVSMTCAEQKINTCRIKSKLPEAEFQAVT